MVLILISYVFGFGFVLLFYFLKMLNLLKSKSELKNHLIPLFYYSDFSSLIKNERDRNLKSEYEKVLQNQKKILLIWVLGTIILSVVALAVK